MIEGGPTPAEMGLTPDDVTIKPKLMNEATFTPEAEKAELAKLGLKREYKVEGGDEYDEFKVEKDPVTGDEIKTPTAKAERDHQGDLQVIQLTRNGESVTENAKFTDGQSAGKELRREHPGTNAVVPLGEYGSVTADVFELGAEKKADGYAPTNGRFRITESGSLASFEQQFPPEKRSPCDPQVPEKGTYVLVRGELLTTPLNITVNGRPVRFTNIGKLSINFSPDGKATDAWLHSAKWEEVQ